MHRLLIALLFVTSLCSAATPSATAPAAPATADIAGLWKGAAPDGSEVSYEFSKDGKVNWTVGNRGAMSGKYEVTRKDNLTRIDLFDFESPRLAGLRFLGIAEVTGDKMKFFFVASKDGKNRDGTPAIHPKEFPADALLLTKSK
jgi:hypothetical protein